MSEYPWHPSQGPRPDLLQAALENAEWERELLTPAGPGLAAHADCCIGRALYRVVLPPTGQRTQPAELLLCAHHLRQSRARLLEQGATIYNQYGTPLDTEPQRMYEHAMF